MCLLYSHPPFSLSPAQSVLSTTMTHECDSATTMQCNYGNANEHDMNTSTTTTHDCDEAMTVMMRHHNMATTMMPRRDYDNDVT